MSAKHTPTPWKATESGQYEDCETFEIEPAMQSDGLSAGYRWFTRADAELIVRAVNSHEALLEAAKKALWSLEQWSRSKNGPLAKELRMAIAQAKTVKP